MSLHSGVTRMNRRWYRIVPNLGLGVVAGLVAAVVTALAMAASRYWLGVSPPPEAVPDRIAALLSIDTFFSLFGKYGGYSGLKKFGILSGVRSLAGVGGVVGFGFALLMESRWARRSRRRWLGIPRVAWGTMAGAVLVVWIGFVIFLWPVLPVNYRGVPYTQARALSIAALLAWYVLFAVTVMVVFRACTSRRVLSSVERAIDADVPRSAAVLGRRGLLAAAAGAVMTVPFYRLMRRMYDDATFPYDGRPNSGIDIAPITPLDRFYTVTKNVVDPDVDRDLWRLEIRGAIDRDATLAFGDLDDFEHVAQESTLMCISNKIGAGLFSNANWEGVRLRDVLMAAGVHDDAYEIRLSGADAYVDTFGMEYALDENTLLAYRMNGQPLPRRHGYPVRVVVPGLFGEKNVKWVTRIDVVTEDERGFYEQQGWGPSFVPPTRSDIFRPRTQGAGQSAQFREPIAAGTRVDLRGRAFAADRGIRSIEVTTDDGETWQPATIYYPGTSLTWTLWRYTWVPEEPGEYPVYSRAVDGNGDPQPSEPRGIIPQGAQGYNIVTATVV
jgi:DMSO/TMAO reductase YedYZ molybdopterin-dependent catalytic subunit